MWDSQTGESIAITPVNKNCADILFSPDGEHIYVFEKQGVLNVSIFFIFYKSINCFLMYNLFFDILLYTQQNRQFFVFVEFH